MNNNFDDLIKKVLNFNSDLIDQNIALSIENLELQKQIETLQRRYDIYRKTTEYILERVQKQHINHPEPLRLDGLNDTEVYLS